MLKEHPVERLQHNADADGRKLEAEFSHRLLSLIPLMGSVSRSLCRDTDLSEDIVQEALCKAWKARSSFRPGSNLKAWLLTIVRNTYYQHCRRAWRRVPLDEDMLKEALERAPYLTRKTPPEAVEDRRFAEAVYRVALESNICDRIRFQDVPEADALEDVASP